MKYLFFIASIFILTPAVAQNTSSEIAKFKIAVVNKIWVTKGKTDTSWLKTFYDGHGNDTAEYSNGKLDITKKYSYDNKGRVVSRSLYNLRGEEFKAAIFSYNKDGSYKITNKDTKYDMTDYEWYDAKGRMIKSQSPDKNITIYTYDSKGRKIKANSDQANGGTDINIQYFYNSKGQLSKIISSGEYKWTETYTYNAKGLLSNVVGTFIYDSDKEEIVYNYFTYEYWN